MSNIPPIQNPLEMVKTHLGEALLDSKVFRDELTLIVATHRVVDVLKFLRDTSGLYYNFLSDISAVDYYPESSRPERFGVSYHLYSMLYNRRIRVKTFVAEDAPIVPTSTVLWLNANWLEREIMDMMGIEFEGHPDPRRLLMPEDWQGHPHRRDYPLGYETIMFSFNVEDIAKHKPFATRMSEFK